MYRQLVCYCNKAQLQLVAYTDFFYLPKQIYNTSIIRQLHLAGLQKG